LSVSHYARIARARTLGTFPRNPLALLLKHGLERPGVRLSEKTAHKKGYHKAALLGETKVSLQVDLEADRSCRAGIDTDAALGAILGTRVDRCVCHIEAPVRAVIGTDPTGGTIACIHNSCHIPTSFHSTVSAPRMIAITALRRKSSLSVGPDDGAHARCDRGDQRRHHRVFRR